VLAGLRRLLLLVFAVSSATLAVGLLAGLAFGSDPWRAVSTGFYLVGSFLLLAGVAVGARGPMRPTKTSDAPKTSMLGLGVSARGMRAATAEERREGTALAWLFLMLGAVLIVFGILADGGIELV
jgi:hypothetical protein